MAGVYIPKLKKAKSCDECAFLMSNKELAVCAVKMAIFLTNNNQPGILDKDTCPLVGVPNHGDLIEMDAVAYKVCEEIPCEECKFYENNGCVCVLQTKLEEMPVVIQADKEEE